MKRIDWVVDNLGRSHAVYHDEPAGVTVELANGRTVQVPHGAPMPERALNERDDLDALAKSNRELDKRISEHKASKTAKAKKYGQIFRVDKKYLKNGKQICQACHWAFAEGEWAKPVVSGEGGWEHKDCPGTPAPKSVKELERIEKAITSKREWRGAEPIGEREVTGIGLCRGWRKGAAVAWLRVA